jgi:cardiolipin synthase
MTDPARKIDHKKNAGEEYVKENVWTLANGLSLIRILLLPFILYFLSRDDCITLATVLMVIAGFTDLLDGYFARRYGGISKMGLILDPLADKLSIGSITAFLVFLKGFPLWLVVAVILRDIAILAGGVVLLKAKGSPLSSNIAGKWTTASLALTIFSFMFNADSWVKVSFVWLSTGLLILSSSLYLTIFIKLMKQRGPVGMQKR